MKKGSAPP